MAQASFRSILNEFLEEKAPDFTRKTESKVTFTEEDNLWRLSFNRVEQPAKKASYPQPPRKSPPPTEVKPEAKVAAPAKKTEKILPISLLKPEDRTQIQTLIQLGASELTAEISLGRIKKAHRRLAKKLHPDRGGNKESFMLLQEAYEQISRSWPQYESMISERASDSGSASAEGSPHRAAA